jgi:hypothetical protein
VRQSASAFDANFAVRDLGALDRRSFTIATLCLALAAFAAQYLVTDGFDRVWLVVPFAFALVILPGLIATFLVDAAWRALTAKRRRPAARRTQSDTRALRPS